MKGLNLILSALFLTTAACAQNTGSISLKKGQKFQVVSVVNTHSVSNMMGQEIANDMDIHSSMTISVDEVRADAYDLTSTLTDMEVKMRVMGQEMNYDSKNPDAANPLAGELNSLINQSQSVTVNKQNKVIKTALTDNASAILQQMESSGAGSRAAFLSIPAKLKVNDTFEATETDTALGSVANLKYQVKSIKDGIATLAFNGTVNVKKTMEQQGMEMETDTKGKIEGETLVDVKTGIVKSSRSESEADGVIHLMGQELPISVKATTVVTVTESK